MSLGVDALELARRLGGEFRTSGAANPTVTGFATDSREVLPGFAFLAIRGAQVDGHAFVGQAMHRGASLAIVERGVATPHILVPNLVSALARMAETYRDEYCNPVIGITGSAGKSSTKEFAAAALGPNAVRTEGNRNTEYTAPLLWVEALNRAPQPTAVVVEMGMRGMGQIAHLASFSKPSIGVITNIGVAHLSEMGSRDAIAQAKSELLEALPQDGVSILWAEDDYLAFLTDVARSVAPRGKVLTFGTSERADARVVSQGAEGFQSSKLEIDYRGERFGAVLPVVGSHFALNAAAGFLAAVESGTEPEVAAARLSNVELPPMRMEVRRRKDVTYVLDMYNASPPGVMGALATVREVIGTSGSKFLAVLGEMRELGDLSSEGHREVGHALAAFDVDEALILAANPADPAPYIAQLRDAAIEAGMDAANVRIASSHEEVNAYLAGLQGSTVVLVKGSRAVELERAMPEGLL